jgi:asparagine synthase (glutamine-hydrolysing)
MTGDSGTILVFNGEVYNHAELRGELEHRGHRFTSRCDTEVVLKAFEEWDVDAFAKLRGMFAAAFYIPSERRLVLVRDRLGIKPLYYSRRGSDLYFGSELKAILAHSEIDRTLNLEGLDHYLSLNYVPWPHTLIEGIKKVPAGNWLEWREGRVSIEPYWQLDFRPDPSIDLPSAKEELDRLLRSSVREHLISDVPLGVWSSGGLDSSTVLHYAAEAHPGIKTFSVSFQGRSFDESSYFRQVSKHYGTEHHEFDLSPEVDLASAIEDIAYYSDEPSADAGAVPVWFLSRMCRRHVTVALSGEGADELFGGYNTYLADRYARILRIAPKALRGMGARLAHMMPVSDEKIGLDYKITRMLEGSVLDPVEAHLFWNGTFSRDQKRRLLERGMMHPASRLLCTGDSGYLNRFLWLDQKYYLQDDILYKCDRMSMAHSLEVRPPFLDHRIVEFAATLPENLKIRGGTLKFVLRELMRDRLLPSRVITRSKEGFDIPAHHWLRTVLRPLLLDAVNERSVREAGVFAWGEVARLLDAHMQRHANLGYHLWGLLVLFLWMKRWGIAPPSRSAEMRPAATVSVIS